MKICLNQDYVAVRRDPGKVGNTAFQDYLPMVGDPGKVGNTAQEKSPEWLRHFGSFVFWSGKS